MHILLASLKGGGVGGGANVGPLQMSSAIAPPTGALFFIKFPTLSQVPGALQHANGIICISMNSVKATSSNAN